MAKIDLEKLICSLAKRKYFSEEKLQGALNEQGLEYKDGEIVEVQKSKFKAGDCVVTSYGKVNQVITVDKDGDGFTLDDDTYFSGSWKDKYHLWSIADAKDGDVLYSLDSKQSFIFKHRKPNEQAESEAFAIIGAYNKTAKDWEDLYSCPIMNTPFEVDKKLLWICPVPCVRKYLEQQCGYKTRWYHKLFWRGKKHF